MTTYSVNFEFECPDDDATPEEVEAWIHYCLGWRADISLKNPLHEYDICNVTMIDVM